MVVWTNRDILYLSAEAVVGLVTITGNIIVLIAIIWTKSLHNITNVFIGNLAVADIAVGIFVAPCAVLTHLGLPSDKYGCIFINCAILMFTNISILMLLTIAVERFVAIRFPFTYKKYATIKSAILVNLSIWVMGSVLGLLPMFGWNIAPDDLSECAFTSIITMEYMVYFQFFAVTLTPLLIMFFIYLYIFFIVRQHSKQTRTLENMFQDPQNASRHRRRFDKDVQAAKMFATLFFLFGLFWLPINIMNSITLFCDGGCPTPYELLLTTIVLSHANSSVNPFLYAANNSRIKLAIKDLFSLKHSERSQFDSNSQVPTSHAVKEHKSILNANMPRNSSNEQVPQNLEETSNNAQSTNQHENVENAMLRRTTKVSFVTKPNDIDHINEITVDNHTLKKDCPPCDNKKMKMLNQTYSQTHSFRDEIDNTILDRLTPLEGIMANIYNSLDSETRDIIENRGISADHNTQHVSDCADNPSLCPPNTSSGIEGGFVNHAFVDNEKVEDSNEESLTKTKISFIEIQEPNKCSSSPHLLTASTTSRHDSNPKLFRSNNVQSKDILSSSISQDSAVNIVNDTHFSESTDSLNTRISVTPQNNSNHMLSTCPQINHSTRECPNSRPHSTTFQGLQPTVQNLFVMEPEDDDSIMSVKYFKESQETTNSNVTFDIELPFDDRGILKNECSEITHL